MSQKNTSPAVPKNEPPNNRSNVGGTIGGSGDTPGTNQSNEQQQQQTNKTLPESEFESEKRLGEIFKNLDRDGNGRIDIQELTSALKGSGMPHQYAEVSSLVSVVVM